VIGVVVAVVVAVSAQCGTVGLHVATCQAWLLLLTSAPIRLWKQKFDDLPQLISSIN